jgi:hypothetical protein
VDGAVQSGITDPMETGDVLEDFISRARWGGTAGNVEVVFESYTVTSQTAQKSQQHWSLELIGVGRWLARKHFVKFVEPLQSPAEAKRFCPDARLRAMNLWVPGGPDHERDALRHLVLRLAKHRLIDVPSL